MEPFFFTLLLNKWIYWTYMGCAYVIWVKTNCTTYFQVVQKTTPIVNLVIADILEGLHVPEISNPPFSIPFWNAKSLKYFFVTFPLSMLYLHDDDDLLIFYPKDSKWTKELSSWFFIYNFKVGHESWTCVNPLCLVNPQNQNKTVLEFCLSMFFYHFSCLIFVCAHFIFIGMLYT